MAASVDVVFFDVNESLSDMTPLVDRLTGIGVPGWVKDVWFGRVLRDGFAMAATGAVPTFLDIAKANMAALLLAHGRPPATIEQEVALMLSAFAEFDVHPDVVDGVRALSRADVRLFTLVIGSPAMTLPMFDRAGIGSLFEGFLGPTDLGAWKPTPQSYLRACEIVGVDPSRALLLSTHPWDVAGAQRAGLTGVWIQRSAPAYPAYLPEPSHVVHAVGEVASIVG
jgi:2-haloacid dehalogenase